MTTTVFFVTTTASLLMQCLALAPSSRMTDDKGQAYATAPWDATFKVNIDGKPEQFTVRVHPEWAPEGAKRFQDIAHDEVFNDARFFRVIPDFMAQFGIPGNPTVAAEWREKSIPDDAKFETNSRGRLTFASSGPDTRQTQMFINFKDNSFLDSTPEGKPSGFVPFAEVLDDGMNVVEKIQSKYRETPDQGRIGNEGNQYLSAEFPDLSYVSSLESSFLSGTQEAAATARSAPSGFLQRTDAMAL